MQKSHPAQQQQANRAQSAQHPSQVTPSQEGTSQRVLGQTQRPHSFPGQGPHQAQVVSTAAATAAAAAAAAAVADTGAPPAKTNALPPGQGDQRQGPLPAQQAQSQSGTAAQSQSQASHQSGNANPTPAPSLLPVLVRLRNLRNAVNAAVRLHHEELVRAQKEDESVPPQERAALEARRAALIEQVGSKNHRMKLIIDQLRVLYRDSLTFRNNLNQNYPRNAPLVPPKS